MFRLICTLSLLTVLGLQAQELPDLAQVVALYEEKSAAILEASEAKEAQLYQKYNAGLLRKESEARRGGDLDALLQFREEIKRVDTGGLDPNAPGPTPEIEQFRQSLREQLAKIARERDLELVEMQEKYLGFLEDMQRRYTMDNQVEMALSFRTEEERIRGLMPELPDSPEPEVAEQPQAAPVAGEKVAFMWNRGLPGGQAFVKAGEGEAKPIKIVHKGDNRIGARGLECNLNGGSGIPELGRQLSRAVKESNEFTLAVSFMTKEGMQRGPARIVGLSRDAALRNVTLGHNGENLILRLRTTATDLNGTNPELNLGPIKEHRAERVLIVFGKEGLKVYRGGRLTHSPELPGDLSNWEDMEFVFGNEAVGGRPWQGFIYRVEFSNRAMADADAARKSATL